MLQSGPPPCTQLLLHTNANLGLRSDCTPPDLDITHCSGSLLAFLIKLILRGRITTSRIPYQLCHYTHTLHKSYRHPANTHPSVPDLPSPLHSTSPGAHSTPPHLLLCMLRPIRLAWFAGRLSPGLVLSDSEVQCFPLCSSAPRVNFEPAAPVLCGPAPLSLSNSC